MRTEWKVKFIKKTKTENNMYAFTMRDYRGSQTYKLEEYQIRHLIETLDNAII